MNREGVEGITGAEIADGKDECIKAVRRQIGAGADWIKVGAVILVIFWALMDDGCILQIYAGKGCFAFVR
jgi:hypothetical protein